MGSLEKRALNHLCTLFCLKVMNTFQVANGRSAKGHLTNGRQRAWQRELPGRAKEATQMAAVSSSVFYTLSLLAAYICSSLSSQLTVFAFVSVVHEYH
jgi:hypothetical protein